MKKQLDFAWRKLEELLRALDPEYASKFRAVRKAFQQSSFKKQGEIAVENVKRLVEKPEARRLACALLPLLGAAGAVGAANVGVGVLLSLVQGHGIKLVRQLYNACVLAILIVYLGGNLPALLCSEDTRAS